MQLICTYAPAVHDAELGRDLICAVFDAFVEGKGLVVALTTGVLQGQALEDVKVSPAGQRVIARLSGYLDFRHPNGVLVVAGVASVAGATQRVRKLLTQAPEGCGLLLVCADDHVYDKAFAALNVDLKSLQSKAQ